MDEQLSTTETAVRIEECINAFKYQYKPLRHKHPKGNISALQESVVKGRATAWPESGSDFQFATAVAIFGMKLRGISDVSTIPWDGVR